MEMANMDHWVMSMKFFSQFAPWLGLSMHTQISFGYASSVPVLPPPPKSWRKTISVMGVFMAAVFAYSCPRELVLFGSDP